jgi:hypothetical protein
MAYGGVCQNILRENGSGIDVLTREKRSRSNMRANTLHLVLREAKAADFSRMQRDAKDYVHVAIFPCRIRKENNGAVRYTWPLCGNMLGKRKRKL